MMKRLLAAGLTLALCAQAGSALVAQTSGVSLGRPQVMPAAPAPTPIRQAGFAVGAPVPSAEPDLSYFASGGANWPLPATPSAPAAAPVPRPLPAGPMPNGTIVSTTKSGPAPAVEPLPPPRPLPSPVPAPTAADVTLAAPDCGDCCSGGCGDCCSDPCCDPCCGHGHWLTWLHPANWCCKDHCYASAEYLIWWVKGDNSVPLVTTGTGDSLGALGAPGTGLLFGGPNALTHDAFGGGRFTVGFWKDPDETYAFETTFFFLGSRSNTFNAASPGSPLLARPFFSANTNSEASRVLASPGVSEGAIRIDAPTNFWGIEANWKKNLYRDGGRRWDLLCGGRFLELREGLHIADFTRALGVNDYAITQDNFDTQNQFWGSQIGLGWECQHGPWSIAAQAKVALGLGYRSSTISGNTLNQTAGGAVTVPGGLLALPSNIGRSQDSTFAVVPEVGVKIGYQVTEGLRFYVGYNCIFWSNVYRPGDQVDRVINTAQVPNNPQPGAPAVPVNRPIPLRQGSQFWAQGLNFGMEYRY